MLPSDYIERVYAGVLGKTIGVRHGSNDEGWSYEKIRETFGEVTDYLFTFRNFAADDDTNGTFLLPLALRDYGFAPGTGQLGMFQGAKSYLLETDEGQTLDTYSISAGLDYASVGPEHAWLKDIGRVNYSWATDEEAMNAFRDLSQTEGIIPAIESSHAVAGAYKAAADLKAKGYDKAVMIVNISGRGDKDMATAGKWFGYLTDDQAAALDVTGAHGNTVA